eukprot:SAG11_NODE_23584_length_386_cov_0.710801_1_plen_20_part_01
MYVPRAEFCAHFVGFASFSI